MTIALRVFAVLLVLPRQSSAKSLRTQDHLSKNQPTIFKLVRARAPYVLPDLGFPYDALEGSFVGSQTMHLHHDKHHAFYVNTLNAALEKTTDAPAEIDVLLRTISQLPADIRGVVRNHGGGHMNHAMFWKWLTPGGSTLPQRALKDQILKDFESIEKFRAAFEAAAATRFGSGWAWLIWQPDKQHLKVCSTSNQDNPIMDLDIGDCHGEPVLGLDVWEHAYYLDYNNLRLNYVKAFWNVANWDQVEKQFSAAVLAKKETKVLQSASHFVYVSPLVVAGLCLAEFWRH